MSIGITEDHARARHPSIKLIHLAHIKHPHAAAMYSTLDPLLLVRAVNPSVPSSCHNRHDVVSTLGTSGVGAAGMGTIRVEAIGVGRSSVGTTGVATRMVGVTSVGTSRVGTSAVVRTKLGPP
jgi:hypothetical protein